MRKRSTMRIIESTKCASAFIAFNCALILSVTSCIKNNPDPSWLVVNDWELFPNIQNGYEGELTHDFSDAWVYVDDELIGVFEVPFKIPILKSGIVNVRLYPAVLNNGISATKKIYPFVEPYEITLELLQNDEVTVNPVTKYYNNVVFTIIDFEDANSHIVESPSSLTNIYYSSSSDFLEDINGNAFGRVDFTENTRNWIAATNFESNLPRGGAEVYLEVDHRSTVDLTTGLLAISPSNIVKNPNVRINKQEEGNTEWKKIYIELTTIVSGSPSADYFEHTFEADMEIGQNQGFINLDNIKIIHFQ
jgi:hypothetical protein